MPVVDAHLGSLYEHRTSCGILPGQCILQLTQHRALQETSTQAGTKISASMWPVSQPASKEAGAITKVLARTGPFVDPLCLDAASFVSVPAS